MVLLPSAYLTPSPSSVRTSPSQYPALEEHKREDYEWVRMLVPRQPGSDIRNWAAEEGHVCEQDKQRCAGSVEECCAWTLTECRAMRRFQADSVGTGLKAATKDSGTLGGRIRQVRDSLGISEDGIDSINR